MSKSKRKHAAFFDVSIICSVASSLSLLAAMLVNSEGKNQEILLVCGLLFWIGLLLEQVFIWSANRLMKLTVAKGKHRIHGGPGILSLPTYPEGLVADVAFILSLIALLLCIAFEWGEAWMQFLLICLMVLSFRLHCFLNGRNYKYRKLKERKVDRKNG